MDSKKITVFAGHFGSGKTMLSVNYALHMAKNGKPVTVCDLDIVNPYFRLADYKDIFEQHNIRLISSPYANTNLEIPAMPTEAQAIFDNESSCGVIDLGGDRGALALGRYAKHANLAKSFEMLLVVNKYRPNSRSIRDIIKIKEEIESDCGVRFTGMVNNPNLGRDTTLEHINESLPFIAELSMATGLPCKFTSVRKDLYQQHSDMFPIEIYEKPNWKI
jgi:MinD-like ATPase involved in chromosome partitioning or flagellar assembly